MSHNKIKEIPDLSFVLNNFIRLKLSYNEIKKIPKSLSECKKLGTIYLDHNKIEEIHSSFCELNRLRKVDLSYNKIKIFPDKFDTDKNQFVDLNLSNNQLQKIPSSVWRLEKLTKLRMDNNKIETIPNSISNLNSLNSLDLGHNKIKKIPELFPGKMNYLKELYLNDNLIEELPYGFIEIGCRRLYLNNNKLKKFPVEDGDYPNLDILYLDGNEISEIPEFWNFDTTIFSISNNRIKKIPEMFSNASSEYINLAHNKISEIAKYKRDDGLPNIRKKIILNGNPLDPKKTVEAFEFFPKYLDRGENSAIFVDEPITEYYEKYLNDHDFDKYIPFRYDKNYDEVNKTNIEDIKINNLKTLFTKESLIKKNTTEKVISHNDKIKYYWINNSSSYKMKIYDELTTEICCSTQIRSFVYNTIQDNKKVFNESEIQNFIDWSDKSMFSDKSLDDLSNQFKKQMDLNPIELNEDLLFTKKNINPIIMKIKEGKSSLSIIPDHILSDFCPSTKITKIFNDIDNKTELLELLESGLDSEVIFQFDLIPSDSNENTKQLISLISNPKDVPKIIKRSKNKMRAVLIEHQYPTGKINMLLLFNLPKDPSNSNLEKLEYNDSNEGLLDFLLETSTLSYGNYIHERMFKDARKLMSETDEYIKNYKNISGAKKLKYRILYLKSILNKLTEVLVHPGLTFDENEIDQYLGGLFHSSLLLILLENSQHGGSENALDGIDIRKLMDTLFVMIDNGILLKLTKNEVSQKSNNILNDSLNDKNLKFKKVEPLKRNPFEVFSGIIELTKNTKKLVQLISKNKFINGLVYILKVLNASYISGSFLYDMIKSQNEIELLEESRLEFQKEMWNENGSKDLMIYPKGSDVFERLKIESITESSLFSIEEISLIGLVMDENNEVFYDEEKKRESILNMILKIKKDKRTDLDKSLDLYRRLIFKKIRNLNKE